MSSARLEALLEISDSIAGTRDLQEILHRLAPALRKAVEFDYVAVVLHEPETDTMRLHVIEILFDVEQQPPPLATPIDQGPSGIVFRTQKHLILDVETETRFPEVIALLKSYDINSCCYLPLTTTVRRVGALTFGSDQPGKFNDADMPFLMRVANQVAIAIDNAWHFENSQRYQDSLCRERDRLRTLLVVNNAIASQLDFREFLRTVSRSLQHVVPHDLVSISLHEPEFDRLKLFVVSFPGGQGAIREGLSIPVKGTIIGRVLTERKPLLFDDLQRPGVVPDELSELNRREGLRSGASFPLIVGDRAIATMEIVSRKKNAVSEADLEFLNPFADQVAVGLANALVYKEIEDLKNRLQDEKLYLQDEIRSEYFDELVGASPALTEVLEQVRTVAETDSTALILGETGTGKELIARAIHNSSPRRQKTFVKLNCSAIPTGLLESELFGHERGAFTGAISQKLGRMELADRGTLFLDEIGDIPLELQPKLLRALQEREFERLGGTRTIHADIRLIAATHRNLTAMVAGQQFRSDLYYRLNVFPIRLPPLRDRGEDIPRLVRHFTRKHSQRMKKQIDTIPVETMQALSQWHWPGNVRELENLIERAVILTRGSSLNVPVSDLRDFEPEVVSPHSAATAQNTGTLAASDREHILKVLRETKGVLGGANGAAARLGLKRTTLQGKMRKLGITRDAF